MKKPEYVKRLNKLLPRVIELCMLDNTNTLFHEFDNIMDKFGLKIEDINYVKKGNTIWVIEPQDYIEVTTLNKNSEAIIEDLFGLKEITNNDIILTTGDGPGFGDKWYKADEKQIDLFKKFISKNTSNKNKINKKKRTKKKRTNKTKTIKNKGFMNKIFGLFTK